MSISTSSGGITISASGGGTGSPGGLTTEVQYNDAGSFAGDATFTFDSGTQVVGVNSLNVNGVGIDFGTSAPFLHLTGDTKIAVGNTNKLYLETSGLSTDRTLTAPDLSGTLALGTGTSNQIAYWADANTIAATSSPTLTELRYLSGVTSGIQAQINGKQASGNYITALTGDVSASGPGSVAATLATVNSNIGTFGSTSVIPSFTVNAKGLVTAVSTSTIAAPAGALTGTTLASGVTGSSLTSVGTIATGVWNGTAVGPQWGGTGLNTSASTEFLSIMSGVWAVNSTSSQRTLLGAEGTITAGTTAQYWRGDKSFQTLNQAAVAGLTRSDSPTFTGVNVTNATSSGTLGVPKDKTLAISGQVSVNSSSAASSASTLKFHDGAAERVLNPEKCFAPAWVIENPTAAEDIPIMVFNNTSTITKVKAVNKTSGDTITFNLGYGASRATATSSLTNVFSSNQTVTATTTISSLTLNGTLTPGKDNILRFYTTAASASQFTLDVCYRENS